MSVNGDAARERRWRADGGTRLTARVSGGAHDALVLLAARYGADQRQVLDKLLLAAGAVLLGDNETQLLATMREHRMSRVEAEIFRDMVSARVSPEVSTHG